ncbi:hypothetical protein TTRE_0000375201 [Trichuris trichiura]|uniref:Uncharacterized protein n=1 Tax=Trichuris trichiura TaxID=36087 RepID=A0A077Z9V1_TRITR|nr:hypothetical protein TTRE_0000375201 [Trichuris trichiura]
MNEDLFVDNDREEFALFFMVHMLLASKEKDQDCLCFSAGLSESIAIVMEMLSDNQQLDALEAVLFMVACAEKKIISRVENCWGCWNTICICSHAAYGCPRGAQNDITNRKLLARVQNHITNRMLMMLLENDIIPSRSNGDNDCRDEEAVKRLIEVLLRANFKRHITFEKVPRRKIWMILLIGWVGQVSPQYSAVSSAFERDFIYHDS